MLLPQLLQWDTENQQGKVTSQQRQMSCEQDRKHRHNRDLFQYELSWVRYPCILALIDSVAPSYCPWHHVLIINLPSRIHMFDIGSQCSKFWLIGVIFCTALSEYNQVKLEGSNWSLVLFESIIRSMQVDPFPQHDQCIKSKPLKVRYTLSLSLYWLFVTGLA